MGPAAASISHSEDVSWYIPGPPKLPANIVDLLEKWSGINPEEAEHHVQKIIFFVLMHVLAREGVEDPPVSLQFVSPRTGRSRKSSLIPTIVGGYRFITLELRAHASYDAIVTLLKTVAPGAQDSIFVDLGCCAGQDLRCLAYDGVPSSQLVGVDMEPAFFEIGFDLFRDRGKLESQFYQADIMSLSRSDAHELAPLMGRVSVVWASALLHLWNLEGQLEICRKISLLLQDKPGVRISGRQVGSRTPGEMRHVTSKSGLMYRHNPSTFRKMWASVLGHVVGMESSEKFHVAGCATWEVQAWFEEDDPSQTQHNPVDDWITKILRDSSVEEHDPSSTIVLLEESVAVLVWQIVRLT